MDNWLKKNYSTHKFGPPTWRWVVKIVGDSAGGNHQGLADQVARKTSHVIRMRWNLLLCTVLVLFAICRIRNSHFYWRPTMLYFHGRIPRYHPVLLFVHSCEVVAASNPSSLCRLSSTLRVSHHPLLSMWLLLLAGDVEINPGS